MESSSSYGYSNPPLDAYPAMNPSSGFGFSHYFSGDACPPMKPSSGYGFSQYPSADAWPPIKPSQYPSGCDAYPPMKPSSGVGFCQYPSGDAWPPTISISGYGFSQYHSFDACPPMTLSSGYGFSRYPSRDACAPMISISGFSQYPSDDALYRKNFFTFNQQNVKEKDALPDISSISHASSDDEWTSTDDDKGVDVDDDIDELFYGEDTEVCKLTEKEKKDKAIQDELVACYDQKMKHFKDTQPSFEKWIDSWTEKKNTVLHWLSVYGYLNKNTGCGGYGVILRNMWSVPIIAATYFTRDGRSQLFQVLNGLKMGLQLAAEHQIPSVEVVCNVQKAVDLLGKFTFQKAGDCIPCRGRHEKKDGFCKDCTKRRASVKMSSLESLIPVIAEIKKLQAKVGNIFEFSKVYGSQNQAAHYLAIKAEVGEDVEVDVYERIVPDDFPLQLKKILYKDAFGDTTRYSQGVFSMSTRGIGSFAD